MNMMRNIGFNIQKQLAMQGLSPQEFGHALNYPKKDVSRILEGLVCLPPQELDLIAEYLGATRKDLMSEFTPNEYTPHLRFLEYFSDKESADTVLDILDDYLFLLSLFW